MKLPDHIVYTYKLLSNVDLNLADDLLSGDEKRYLDSVRHEGRRREFKAGRILARQLAGDMLGRDPKDVLLVVAGDGSLELPSTDYSISLAHSHEGVCAALALSDPVGIDLETIKPRHEDLYKFIFHPDEYALIDSAGLEKDELLILSWTLKEATLKAMKTGFRCSPKKLRLSISLEESSATIDAPGNVQWHACFEKRDGCYLSVAYALPD